MAFLCILMCGIPLMLYSLALGTPLDHGLLLSNCTPKPQNPFELI